MGIRVEELAIERYSAPEDPQGSTDGSRRGSKSRGRGAGYTMPENVAERFASFLENEEYLSLREELSISRTLLQTHLDVWSNYAKQAAELQQAVLDGEMEPQEAANRLGPPPIKLEQLNQCLDMIGKLMAREHDLVYSPMNTITVEAAAVFAASIADIVNRYVADPGAREAVAKAIRELLTSGRGFNVDMRVIRRLLDTRETTDDL